SAVRAADRIIGLLEKEDIEPPKLIINRIRTQMMMNGDVMDIDEITTHLSIELLCIIMDDDEVIRSSNRGDPVAMLPNNR
ncbi:septum site-determining protein MinD, partial [Listeria monocytogenes]|nr:septum site-determining protein MinD [Listeria monocytogenes]